MSEAFYWADRADVTTSTAKENVEKLSSNHRNATAPYLSHSPSGVKVG